MSSDMPMYRHDDETTPAKLTLSQQITLWKQEVALLQERYADHRNRRLPIPLDLFNAVERLKYLEQQERMQKRIEALVEGSDE